MKTAILILVAFSFGIIASSQTIVGPMTIFSGHNQESSEMNFVLNFDEVEAKRAESGNPYIPFFDVDSMHCGIYSLAAGAVDGQQPHTEDEVYFVQEGEAKIQIKGVDYDLSPGSIVFVPAYAEHKFHSITKDLKTLVFFSKFNIEKPAEK